VALDPGSPLSLLLRPGDILLSVVGRPVSSAADVAALLADKEPHEVVEFIYRRNGKDTWVASRLLPPR
jgi:S1-C subfamily serine protease